MKKWSSTFKNFMLVLLSVITFGMISPSQYQAWTEGVSPPKEKNPESFTGLPQKEINESQEEQANQFGQFVDLASLYAEEQSFVKFGSRIGPQIKDEFYQVVLPEMEKVITAFSKEYPEERLVNLAITEKPSGGKAEKIFHIYDREQKQDLIRFHVRRENPPGEGYWFHFHYHTYKDKFEEHHSIARIFWSQDTPPNWLS